MNKEIKRKKKSPSVKANPVVNLQKNKKTVILQKNEKKIPKNVIKKKSRARSISAAYKMEPIK